ncbi:MAG TPA: dihydropteroate synthase, partial [Myxococcaceae bacterium]|nr:dihydropteroate synthase [Myxococcaceae bacterium]
MITARAWTAEHRDDLYPALNRLGLPEAAQERLLSKMPHLCVLLTGVGEREVRLFKGGGESLPAYLVGDWQRRPGTALLSGRREQFDRLLGEAAADSTLRELTRALDKLLEHLDGPPAFEVAGRRYPLGGAPYVMGVVNVTPDSFSDGGRFLDTDAAVAHGEALAAAGAHFLDVGGESTRPGARPVRADEELARVLPVLEALRRAVPLPLSIDTAKADV